MAIWKRSPHSDGFDQHRGWWDHTSPRSGWLFRICGEGLSWPPRGGGRLTTAPPPLAVITKSAGEPKWLTPVGNTGGRGSVPIVRAACGTMGFSDRRAFVDEGLLWKTNQARR